MEVVYRDGKLMTRELSAFDRWTEAQEPSFTMDIERELLAEALNEEL